MKKYLFLILIFGLIFCGKAFAEEETDPKAISTEESRMVEERMSEINKMLNKSTQQAVEEKDEIRKEHKTERLDAIKRGY